MRFVHTADWHLGAARYLPDYLKRQTRGVNAVFKLAMKNKIRTVAVSGDLFDNKNVRPEERDALIKLLLHYDNLGFEILVVNGNHDQDSETYTNLRLLRHLYEHKKFHRLKIAISETGPEFHTVGGQDFLLFPGFYNGDVNEALRKLIKGRDHKPVVLMHEVVKGALADNGFPLEKGIRIDPDLPVKYFALGDLHMHQRIAGVKNAWYCGSPIQHDFGEDGQKGILIVDTDKPKDPTFVEVEGFHPSLITVRRPKDALKYPKDFVRVLLKEATTEELPENVVKTDYVRSKSKMDDGDIKAQVEEATQSPVALLSSFLKNHTHVSREARKRAIKLAEKYYSSSARSSEI